MSAEAAYLPLFIFLIVTLIFFYLFRVFLKFNREKKKKNRRIHPMSALLWIHFMTLFPS